MKKIALVLLMSFFACYALQAQGTKSDIMSYLRNEGYSPSYDSDGDITFKLGKYVYYALVRDNEDYSLVEIRAQFRTEDNSLSELYQIDRKSVV